MKLTAKVKLLPTDEQRQYLLETLERANAACDYISQRAWDERVFGTFKLQKLVYADVRERFDLTAQIVVRIVAKVGDGYKLDRRAKRTFRPHGAIAYDDRILRWYTDLQRVSIWSVGGRLNMAYQCGERQRELLKFRKGESDLVYSKARDAFYVLATCDLPDPDEQEIEAVLGVDLGVVNLATTSDGDIHTSATIERNRQKQQRLRTQLQRTGTKSARRHLKKLAGRQRRFQTDTNHVISQRIVQTAQRTNRAIGLEELTGIRARTRVRGTEQRAKHSNWAFAQLRAFLTYKARLAGIPLVLVDPAYTSQRCYVCGHTERANRRSQAEFVCQECGSENHADINASLNIASLAWASVIAPHVSDVQTSAQRQGQATPL